MSVKSALLRFIDNTGLAEVFQRKPHDAQAARQPLLLGIENARKQFTQAPRILKTPNRWWKVNNGVVALIVKIKGDTFDINGVPTNHMPRIDLRSSSRSSSRQSRLASSTKSYLTKVVVMQRS